VAKPNVIELAEGLRIPILYEDRSVLAIDKPAGWLLAPSHWRQTRRNLQAALEADLEDGAFWARIRNLKFLRFVHRLDAETSGVLLLAKSRGAVAPLSALFEGREVAKRYLAVVHGTPAASSWICREPIGDDPAVAGRMRVDRRAGSEAETRFTVLASRSHPQWGELSLVEAVPRTGRTHQIRVHLQAAGHSVVGDPLYANRPLRPGPSHRLSTGRSVPELALRAAALAYRDPFTGRPVQISAPCGPFVHCFFPLGSVNSIDHYITID
jgi:tRNA pseudouridine32 synthase / 23S rRNA pseudouridine746 synthase